jgi:hypothetical protein
MNRGAQLLVVQMYSFLLALSKMLRMFNIAQETSASSWLLPIFFSQGSKHLNTSCEAKSHGAD